MTDLDLPPTEDALLERQSARRVAAFERAKTAPFYADVLRGMDAATILEPEAWRAIPVLDKEQLRSLSSQAFYQDFCLAPRSAIAEFWRSGGSTGRPLYYPRTLADVEYGLIGFQRVLECAGFTKDDITHLSLPLGIHPAGHLMGRAATHAEMGVVWAGGGNTLPSAMQIEMMRLFQPSAWIGMASYGLQLANLARADGFDLKSAGIDKILCTAEPLSASKRAKLADVFGADVRDSFGMTEMMMLGAEDAACEGFRFWADYAYPEILDPETLTPVTEGKAGLLVVTSLVTNNATPFLRWNTGDIVTLRKGTPQGTGYDVFPVIKHTHRTAGFVKVRGVNIGFTDFEDLMFRTPEVADFRVAITFDGTADHLKLFMEPAPAAPGNAADTVAGIVKHTFEITPDIEVLEPGSIAKSFEGSFKPPRFKDERG